MNSKTARTVNVTPLYLANHHVQPRRSIKAGQTSIDNNLYILFRLVSSALQQAIRQFGFCTTV